MRSILRFRREKFLERAPLTASAVLVLTLLAGPVSAADLQANCCDDLEARVAELEASSARKGNRKLTLEISGVVNNALLFWDDGHNRDVYTVSNENSTTSVSFEGEAENLGGGWSAGYAITLAMLNANSSEVSQNDDNATRTIETREASFWISQEKLGKLSMGQTSAAGLSGGAAESDLSGTTVASYVGVSDIGGGFFLRRRDVGGAGGLLNVTWGDVLDSLDEPDGNIVNYTTPELAGFVMSAYWGEDDIWNVTLGYEKEFGETWEIAAAIAHNKNLEGDIDNAADDRTTVGSISVLHKPSGINVSFAAGDRNFIQPVDLNDGTTATPDGPSFFYVKGGWRKKINSLGDTAVYAEFGKFRDVLSRGADETTVEELGGLAAGTACAAPGNACLVSGSEATVWGLGVVQHIDDDDDDDDSDPVMQFYLGYRHHDVDIDLVDVNGAKVRSVPLSGFDTVIGGFAIEF